MIFLFNRRARAKQLAIYSSLAVTLLLTGCATSVTSIPPLTFSQVAGQQLAQMSQAQKTGLIYNYATQGLMINQRNLLTIQPSDMANIDALLNQVNLNLEGYSNNALNPAFANYMLTEFAQTPYEWSQTAVSPFGFDPATRQYFVDVTYSTDNRFKTVIPDSKIPSGSPNQQALEQARYDQYTNYLSLLQHGDNGAADQALSQFTQNWGSVQSIMDDQEGVSLLQRTEVSPSHHGIGKFTYSGLVQNSLFNQGATMTFRFVFKYNYNLGDQTNLMVSAVYLKNYQLDNYQYLLSSVAQSNITGTEVLDPFIDLLIDQYNKAVEEGDNQGLYTLFYNYAGVDKYYNDLNNYVIDTFGAYNFKVLARTGTSVLVEVNRINRFRAENADMTLPTYKETLLFDLVLNSDDQISINSVNLLNSTLVGEPLSVIQDVNGISNMIQFSTQDFTQANQQAVEAVLKQFSQAVFQGTTTSSAFQATVDDGISPENLQQMADYVTAIPNATKKIEYIENWDTQTNSYVSVTIREIFELPDGTALDTQAVVDLANLAGSWKVVDYTRTMNVAISQNGISDQGAFVVNTR